MLVKTATLIGKPLDWAAAKSAGFSLYIDALLGGAVHEGIWLQGYYTHDLNEWLPLRLYKPSTDWAQGGPIIEQERIQFSDEGPVFTASYRDPKKGLAQGETQLVAAMRCYVASKYGETLDIPETLV